MSVGNRIHYKRKWLQKSFPLSKICAIDSRPIKYALKMIECHSKWIEKKCTNSMPQIRWIFSPMCLTNDWIGWSRCALCMISTMRWHRIQGGTTYKWQQQYTRHNVGRSICGRRNRLSLAITKAHCYKSNCVIEYFLTAWFCFRWTVWTVSLGNGGAVVVPPASTVINSNGSEFHTIAHDFYINASQIIRCFIAVGAYVIWTERSNNIRVCVQNG